MPAELRNDNARARDLPGVAVLVLGKAGGEGSARIESVAVLARL